MRLLPHRRVVSAAVLLWICWSDVGLDAANVGTGVATTAAGNSVTTTTASGVSTAGAAANSSSVAANGSASAAVCPPGYICYDWSGPVGIDARYAPETLPSIIVTLLFVGGCIGGAVLISYLANLAYNRYTALPKVTPPDDEDEVTSYDEAAVKRTLLTRLGVMSWKADPAKPQDRFAKRAVLTWLRRVARIQQAPDAENGEATETGAATAAAGTATAVG